MAVSQTNRFLNAHFHHRAVWTPENLGRLYDLCAKGASYDDIMVAFPGWGASTLLTGTRTIIAELIRTIDQQSKVP
jgi:hypothetical protein